MKKKPNKLSPAKVLALWNAGVLLYFLLQVKFVEARYILMLIPTMIILACVFTLQFWKWLVKLPISDNYLYVLKRILLITLVMIFGFGVQQWVNWSEYHRNREETTASIIAGKWLAENAEASMNIYCDETSYVPDKFLSIVREKQCGLRKISELQTDIVMFVNSRYTQYEDSSSVENFLLDKEKFWDIHYFYHAFQDSVYQNYRLWKDFGGARIFKHNQYGKEKKVQ